MQNKRAKTQHLRYILPENEATKQVKACIFNFIELLPVFSTGLQIRPFDESAMLLHLLQ